MLKTALVFASALLLALPLQANPLQELRDTLGRLAGHTPLKASVQLKSESRNSDGEDSEASAGLATVQLEDGTQGLRLSYPQAALSRAAQEDAARAANPKAPAPTATGLRGLGFSDVSELSRAAESLQRDLAKAVFVAERNEPWQGRPARALVFDLPPPKKDKYVKKHESTLEVWLGADGVPLASRKRQRVEGSAFVVINFEVENTEEHVFAVIGERMVATQRISTHRASGAGQKGSGRVEYTLQPQS
ncbi:MAG: hypothetical protein MUE43_13625 [Serpentinimonas sp.]|nr:hypothetical protein [Serpentinimonas sp.]